MTWEDWPAVAATVAAELHFSRRELLSMSFRELGELWYPQAQQIERTRQEQHQLGTQIAIVRAFKGK